MADPVMIRVNGTPFQVPAGTTAAAALFAAGHTAFRESVTGESRGALCGMGICFECRVTIDGEPHTKSCQTVCRSGMDIRTMREAGRETGGEVAAQGTPSFETPRTSGATSIRRRYDVVIAGAGPAGVAAACTASAAGGRVALIDENGAPGGQIWRADQAKRAPREAAAWLDRLRKSRVEILTETRIFDSLQPGVLLAEHESGTMELHFEKLILATGARELFLPFPGWTLPNVMGAGGLQALAKGGLEVKGKRVAVAGSGPLLPAVAAYLRQRGAAVAIIAEQAPLRRMLAFSTALRHTPGKLPQAGGLWWQLRGIPYRTECWPIAAEGEGKLNVVMFQRRRTSFRVECDFLACGFGLVPNLELPFLLGCTVSGGVVVVDEWQQTSLPGVYCAGEPSGVGGVDLAIAEGRIAGHAAAGQTVQARAFFPWRERANRFKVAMEDAFALRDELRHLARPDTTICRCEDVPFGKVAAHHDWRGAKLQTRCGMGVCQGRVCGAAIDFLLGWKRESYRPPLFPVTLEHLAHTEAREGVD